MKPATASFTLRDDERTIRVTFVQSLGGGLVRGGLEIQADRTRAELVKLGVEIDVLTPLTQPKGDLVHFFGTFDSFGDIAEALDRLGLPYVSSPVFMPHRSGAMLRWRAFRKRYLEQSYPKGLKRLYHNAKRLFTLSQVEDHHLRDYFGPDVAPLIRIPNGVDERFMNASPDLFRSEFNIQESFVLHTGSFEPRKNQLAVIHAAKDAKWPLVFAGRVPDPEYLQACQAAAGPEVLFLGDLPHDSPLIPSANAAAEVFCLPSYVEVLSISALEAACCGAKLVLGDTWGAEEHFGEYARYVRPHSVEQIRESLAAQLSRQHDRAAQRAHFCSKYSWSSVAQQIVGQYREVLASLRIDRSRF